MPVINSKSAGYSMIIGWLSTDSTITESVVDHRETPRQSGNTDVYVHGLLVTHALKLIKITV